MSKRSVEREKQAQFEKKHPNLPHEKAGSGGWWFMAFVFIAFIIVMLGLGAPPV